MANTKIPVELSSTPGIVDNSNATAITIDSSENVGIGTDNPSSELHIKGASPAGIFNSQLLVDTTDTTGAQDTGSKILFGYHDGVNNRTGPYIFGANTSGQSGHYSAYLAFGTRENGSNPAERMRIDASGNLLVGKTSTSISTQGLAVNSTGMIKPTTTNEQAALFNRLSSDGDIVQFRKDGTTVGSIGTLGGDVYIGSPTGSGSALRFDGTNNIIYASNASGSARDAALDLGTSSVRFKDLYLSGGAYLGGTGSANKLDDYEEGTWTPVIQGLGGNSASATVDAAFYTKIGRMVHVTCFMSSINIGAITSGNFIILSGLPFTATSYGDFTLAYKSGGWTDNDAIVGGYIQKTATYAYLVAPNGTEQQQTGNANITKLMFNTWYVAS